MDFIKQLEVWAKGDAIQGRVMLVIGILLLVGVFFIWKSSHPILKGMLIPLSVLTLAYIGYGSFLATARPQHMVKASKQYQTQPTETLQQELAKAQKDNKAYTNLKPIWGILIVVLLGLFFVIKPDYYKGLSLGLIIMFFGVFLLDVFLHHRLKPYLHTLQELLS